jgi:hypothetical protein
MLLQLLIAATFSHAQSVNFATVKSQVFDKYCMQCHNPQKHKGGLDFSRYENLQFTDGSDVAYYGMPFIDKKLNPNNSYIYRVIIEGEMPDNDKKVAPRDLDVLRQWILQGATK